MGIHNWNASKDNRTSLKDAAEAVIPRDSHVMFWIPVVSLLTKDTNPQEADAHRDGWTMKGEMCGVQQVLGVFYIS